MYKVYIITENGNVLVLHSTLLTGSSESFTKLFRSKVFVLTKVSGTKKIIYCFLENYPRDNLLLPHITMNLCCSLIY